MTKDEVLKLVAKAIEDGWSFDRIDAEVYPAIKEALAQPEQEPVAWMWLLDGEVWDLCSTKDRFTPMREGHVQVPLYTTPPHRKPLTDVEIQKLLSQNRFAVFALVRAIEQAHGIKEKA